VSQKGNSMIIQIFASDGIPPEWSLGPEVERLGHEDPDNVKWNDSRVEFGANSREVRV